jgi:hypothetical protein
VSPSVACVSGDDTENAHRAGPPTLPPASPEQAADEAADRDAIGAEPLSAAGTAPASEPPADLVEALAEAMVRKPGVCIVDRAAGMPRLRADARRRLSLTSDPMARGLLLGFWRSRGWQG